MASSLCRVEAYEWRDEAGEILVTLPAETYWPPLPGFTWVDGRRYVLVADAYDRCSEPTHEVHECGTVTPIKQWNGRPSYARRRRCPFAAEGLRPVRPGGRDDRSSSGECGRRGRRERATDRRTEAD